MEFCQNHANEEPDKSIGLYEKVAKFEWTRGHRNTISFPKQTLVALQKCQEGITVI